MTTLIFPDIAPARMRFAAIGATQSFTGPLDGSAQTLRLPGAHWYAQLSYLRLTNDKLAQLEAFLAQMEGQAGRCYLIPFYRRYPRGTALGAPTVNGASQTGASLVTAGWTPSQAAALKRGDYFAVQTALGRELKRVTADAAADGAGAATVAFKPNLRASPANGAALIVNDPSAIFRLKDDQQGIGEFEPPARGGFTLELVESFTG